MQTTVKVQRDIYLQYGRHIYSEAYASNMKCMYINVTGHIVDCS